MSLKENFKEAPATMALCASWVVVFVLMMWTQGGLRRGGDLLSGGITPQTSLRFGSQLVGDIWAGQVWRCLTASFIHFSIIHLLVNLVGLYQFGPLLESWYGGAQFLALYVAMALGGNLLAALSKGLLGSWFPGVGLFQDIPSGGGSVVLCGLVGMLAVVGWRSRTRFGDFMRAQMVGILAFTALLGLLLPQIDNFGHAGGAIVGALLGFLHRRLVRAAGQPAGRRVGAAAALVLAACTAAQVWTGWTDRTAPGGATLTHQQRFRTYLEAWVTLDRIKANYLELGRRGPRERSAFNPVEGAPAGATREQLVQGLQVLLNRLEAIDTGLDRGPTAGPYRRLRALAAAAIRRPPTPGEIAAFRACLTPVNDRLRHEIDELFRTDLAAWAVLDQLARNYLELGRRGPSGRAPFNPVEGVPVGLPQRQLVFLIQVFLTQLQAIDAGLDRGPTAGPYRRLCALASAAIRRPPTPGEIAAFRAYLKPVKEQLDLELAQLKPVWQRIQQQAQLR